LEGHKLRGVKREELFELHVLDAEVLDERCEDALDMIAGQHPCGLDIGCLGAWVLGCTHTASDSTV
jgi:hypothetical protein